MNWEVLNTNPKLSEEKKNGRLYAFTKVFSPYNLTSKAIKNMLSTNCIGNGENWADYPFFPSIFYRAGYNVDFWDNQYDPLSQNSYDFSLVISVFTGNASLLMVNLTGMFDITGTRTASVSPVFNSQYTLSIFVIGDIVLQIIYQIPYLSPDQDSVFQKIFEVLGLIKLVDYESGDDGKEIKLIRSGIVEVIGKPLIYFFLSLQIIIYNSKDFKKYYLTFLLNQKNEFNKNSLINTFRFNNERIEAFKNSMNLRLKSEKAMDKLRLILEDWNKKLKLEGSLFEEPKKRPLEFIHEKEEEEKEKEEKNKQEEEEEKEEEEKEEEKKEEEKKEEEKKEEEKEEEEKEEEDSNKINTKVNSLNDQNNILKSIGEKGALGMFEALKKANRKIIEPEKIKEKITEILLSGFITKFYLWFNRNAIYYKTMPERIKRNYEKNCILGNLDIKWEPKILFENIKPEHGYTNQSEIFNDLVKFMINLDKNQRRQFLIFSTGCPRLPIGGFKFLSPKLTVVKKYCEIGNNPDDYLPTVMTCQNYLKIPEYSNYKIFEQKMLLAMKEGCNEFNLS